MAYERSPLWESCAYRDMGEAPRALIADKQSTIAP